MARRISLVNRTVLVFSLSAAGVLAGVVAVPWVSTRQVAREMRRELFREQLQAWASTPAPRPQGPRVVAAPDLVGGGPTMAQVLTRFRTEPDAFEAILDDEVDGRPVQRYVRALRRTQELRLREGEAVDLRPPTMPPAPDDPVEGVVIIDRPAAEFETLGRTKRTWLAASAGVALAALVTIFVILVRHDLLRPVRRLRDTVERVRKGEIGARSAIRTGDEYQRLGEAFNAMLDQFEQARRQLTAINESLDLKLGELSEANVGLYESNRLKSEFLANVSHELRTPLNSIIGFAELLQEIARQDAAADPKRVRYISHILSSGRSLLDMINELLNMAKIEAGRMEVTIEPTSVSDLVEGIVTIMRPQAQPRRVEVVARVPQELPTVETDPGKLQQILYNFLSNAIKFSPEGSTVTITAERLARADGSGGVRIGVQDQGPGIPWDMQDTIFEKFRQVDASHTRRHSGTGLGLAICRELAAMLNATVSLVSQPGQGATFSVELPLEFKGRELPPLMAEA